jgi:hypothetical protein
MQSWDVPPAWLTLAITARTTVMAQASQFSGNLMLAMKPAR